MSKYRIIMFRGNCIDVNADNVQWDSDFIRFYQRNRVVALFKISAILGWFDMEEGIQHDD